jgi:hypothetical protein
MAEETFSDEEGASKVSDELPEDSLNVALSCLQEKNYDGIVQTITGISDSNDDLFEKTVDLVRGIFTKNELDQSKAAIVIKHIFYIVVHNSNNIAALDSNFVSYASQFAPGTYPPEQDSDINHMMHEQITKESLSRLTDFQLTNKISEVRERHKKLLSRGEKISKELVDNLNLLLEEKASRQSSGSSKKKITEDKKNAVESFDVSTNVEKGKYRFWFVQPSVDEISKTINIHVVCGSPIIEVLRKRYKKLYSLEEVQDIRPQDLVRGSPEAQYELKKELKRQEDFIIGYVDPRLVSDQDICAFSIYSAFNTDQFPEVPRFREQANTLGTYFMKHGRLINRFNPDKKFHSLKIEGNIIGRFAVSFNKREKVSGRIINDSYEVVEYQNGRPVLYFYSTKGRSALDQETINSINIGMRGDNMNLLTPIPAQISDDQTLDKYKLKDGDSEIDGMSVSMPGAAEDISPVISGDQSSSLENKEAIDSAIPSETLSSEPKTVVVDTSNVEAQVNSKPIAEPENQPQVTTELVANSESASEIGTQKKKKADKKEEVANLGGDLPAPEATIDSQLSGETTESSVPGAVAEVSPVISGDQSSSLENKEAIDSTIPSETLSSTPETVVDTSNVDAQVNNQPMAGSQNQSQVTPEVAVNSESVLEAGTQKKKKAAKKEEVDNLGADISAPEASIDSQSSAVDKTESSVPGAVAEVSPVISGDQSSSVENKEAIDSTIPSETLSSAPETVVVDTSNVEAQVNSKPMAEPENQTQVTPEVVVNSELASETGTQKKKKADKKEEVANLGGDLPAPEATIDSQLSGETTESSVPGAVAEVSPAISGDKESHENASLEHNTTTMSMTPPDNVSSIESVPDSSVTNSEDTSLPVAQLRSQLMTGIQQKYSASTLNYLITQIAEKEGKTVDIVKSELVSSMPEAMQLLDSKNLNVGIIKERAKKIKDLMSDSESSDNQQN